MPILALMTTTPTTPTTTAGFFDAVQTSAALLLLEGCVLHASNVTAGSGIVIDWRTVRSGELLQAEGDAFDTAALFVTLVGTDAALASVARRRLAEAAS